MVGLEEGVGELGVEGCGGHVCRLLIRGAVGVGWLGLRVPCWSRSSFTGPLLRRSVYATLL